MTPYRIRSQSVRVLLRRGPISVEVVAVLAIEGVLDYGSRGGVNRNSIQQSALSSQQSAVSIQHLALSIWPTMAAADPIDNGAQADLGRDFATCGRLGAKC